MKFEKKIVAFSVFCGVLIWVFDAGLDYFFYYEGTFLQLLVYDVPGHEIYIRSLILLVFLVFGLIVSRGIAQRKEAQEETAQSEENLRITLNSIGDAVISTDTDGRIVLFNPVAQKLTGFSLQEAVGRDVYEVFNIVKGQTNEPAENPVKRVLEEGKVVGLANHTVLISKDGSEYQIADSGAPIRNSAGEITGVALVFRDVTETYRQQEALLESEEKYRNIFENAVEGMFQSTPEGRFIDVNPAFAKMLGYVSPEDVISSISDITTQYFADPGDQHHFAMLLKKDGIVKNFEFKAKRKDGSQIWLSSNSRAVYDPDGKIVLYEGNDIDISERKRAEEAIRDSESKFRNLFEISPQAIALTDVETGKLIDVNNTFCELTQYSKEEIIGRTTVETGFYSDEDRKNFINELQSSGAVDGLEMKFKTKDGSIINALMFARIVEIFKKPQILTIFLDITIQKQLEAQLQQAQKMESIGTLAGGIAHDFNNILFPIIGNAQMLQYDMPEDSPFLHKVDQIHTSALRASDLVKHILTFSRQESGELKLMKMQPIIKEALKLIRSTIPTTIEIKQDIHPDCSPITGDPTQIHQIIMNLATNAAHAMEEKGGELNVRLRQVDLTEPDLFSPNITPGTYVCLSVSDTGKGMDEKLIQKIFDPFYTIKEKGKGTGMGLSVVHGIVTEMKGDIKVYSEPDKGTEFHVYLPAAPITKEKTTEHKRELIQGGSERILLVDDEPMIINMEQDMLERLGYTVEAFTDCLEALEAFKADSDRFDLVITDMAMPKMAGDKLAVELIKIKPGIPVLLCTGFSATMSEEKAASLGIKGFLLKPVIMKDLALKIRKVLDK